MEKIRVRYSKTGKAKYISHLDLVTTMQRSFLRAGVALKYSEGYNPHPYLSVALPASVGVESVCEILDVELYGGSVPHCINSFLPEGIRVQNTYRAWRNVNEIKWLDVECRICFNKKYPRDIINIINDAFCNDNLHIEKKTKRGSSVINAAPYICNVKTEYIKNNDTDILFCAGISAQNPTISFKDINTIIDGIFASDNMSIYEINNIKMKRIEIYDSNMLLFK